MVEYHGGGFTGGGAESQDSLKIQKYLDNGFFFASMNYRLVATKYFYKGPQGHELEEEFLHVNSTGHIWPDTSGKLHHADAHARERLSSLLRFLVRICIYLRRCITILLSQAK